MNEDLLALVGLNTQSQGGTERLFRQIYNRVPRQLLEKFQIWPSRYDPLLVDLSKIQILHVHDLPMDPMYDHLKDGGWNKFHKIIFVSHWQKQHFMGVYGIPWSKCAVLLNAIEPIGAHKKPTDLIRLIYFSTPQRGLEILVPVFKELCKKYASLELVVASSFKLYGCAWQDAPYLKLFEECKNDPNINYIGTVEHSEIIEHIQQSDILAYPSIWLETSCMVLMESMSGGLVCVHPDFGALPETGANWTSMYPFHENRSMHASIFHEALEGAIQALMQSPNKALKAHLAEQKKYADTMYSWTKRERQWIDFLGREGRFEA